MSIELIRRLYDYHRWANRCLFDVTIALGDELAARQVGTQFSYPTLGGMFRHLCGADALWLNRWKGTSPARPPGPHSPLLPELRPLWDAVEREQEAFLAGMTESDLVRIIEYRSPEGQSFRLPLGPLLHHVVNHATHHRSEIATMLTMVSGSPPDTGIAAYERQRAAAAGRVPVDRARAGS